MAKEDLFEEGKQPAAEKPAVNADKLKALRAAMDKIEKNYGKGSIMKLGDESVENIEVIPTGSIALNAALGVGGYPKGRVIEIYGPESGDPRNCRGTKKRWYCSIYRCGTCFRPFLCRKVGSRCRKPMDFPTG